MTQGCPRVRIRTTARQARQPRRAVGERAGELVGIDLVLGAAERLDPVALGHDPIRLPVTVRRQRGRAAHACRSTADNRRARSHGPQYGSGVFGFGRRFVVFLGGFFERFKRDYFFK